MTLDVAARLAEGRQSVANTQTYVTACHAVGYQHPDLTAHPAQILDWFAAEDGLDLTVLDADCAALRAASAAAEEAVRVSRDGLAALTGAWNGDSGSVAVEFVERHCAQATAVAGALRAAAQTCEALRDSLGQLVDEKVHAAVSIDDRRAGERPAWLAAAATATSGGAEVVTEQITPYVDADIRIDWVTAMRAATSSITAAYEDAVRQMNATATVHFEVPGPLGTPSLSGPAPAPQQTVPAAAAPVSSPAPAPALPPPPGGSGQTSLPATNAGPAQPLPPDPLAAAPVPAALDAPASAGVPAMPAMPDVGGGLSGLMGQIADALSGLFDGASDDAVADDVPEEPADEDDPDQLDDTEEPAPEDDPAVEEAPQDVTAEERAVPAPESAEPAETEPPPPPEPAPTPPPAAPAPLAAQPDEQTPCEIAADELPQVGQ